MPRKFALYINKSIYTLHIQYKNYYIGIVNPSRDTIKINIKYKILEEQLNLNLKNDNYS